MSTTFPRRTTLALATASAVALWASFPPCGLWPLAWLAPLGWLILIARAPPLAPPAVAGSPQCGSRNGRRLSLRQWLSQPYVIVWLVGLFHWLMVLQGIRKAHWATHLGWVVLAAYLGLYLPLFISLTRVAVHRLRVPLPWAAPVVWTGLELARGHLISGFSLALLAHTQVRWTAMIQVADLGGAYAVSFVMMLVCATVARCLTDRATRRWLGPACGALLVVLAVLAYGQRRVGEGRRQPAESLGNVALIQGAVDTMFNEPPERPRETFELYRRLTLEACRQGPSLTLVVWPESMFTLPETRLTEDSLPHYGAYRRDHLETVAGYFSDLARQLALEVQAAGPSAREPTYLLVGTQTWYYGRRSEPDLYNSALLIDAAGQVRQRYYKMHPVMFGEYVPLGDRFPWLYRFFPMPRGLTAGRQPQRFIAGRLAISPSICFESTVPHLIRRQLIHLQQQGTPANVLINVTNDGWFWGSSVLDLQLACGMFRAVEARLPLLVAANTGLSAWIDGDGRCLAVGPRRADQVLLVALRSDSRSSWYLQHGDWFAGCCLACCLLLVAFAATSCRRTPLDEKSV